MNENDIEYFAMQEGMEPYDIFTDEVLRIQEYDKSEIDYHREIRIPLNFN